MRGRQKWFAAAAGFVLFVVAAVVFYPRGGEAPAARSAPLAPRTGALFGTWMSRDTEGTVAYQAMVLEREAQLGRRFDVANHFYPFFAQFPRWQEEWDLSLGRTPMISWNGTDTRAINAGAHDDLIRDRARGVAGLDGEVFIRWFWEMDGDSAVDDARSPVDYIAAWTRIRAIFDQEGAENAVWAWCPNAVAFEESNAEQWYPGDDLVDWVCADGYNWAPGMEGARWREWGDIYRAAHNFALQHRKPLMAGEWGALERDPGEKAAWYDDAHDAIQTMPNLAAVITFDERRHRNDVDRWFDWRVDSTPETLLAYMAWARDPYFTPRSAALDPTASVGSVSVEEPDGDGADTVVWVPVTLSAPSPEAVTMTLATRAGSATRGDFESFAGPVEFAPGETWKFVPILVHGDGVAESDETFEMLLNEPSGAVVPDGASATVTITDHPVPAEARLSIGDVSVLEGDAGTTVVRLHLTRTGANDTAVRVSWSMSSVDAVIGLDWSGTVAGTVAFPAGESNAVIELTVRADLVVEDNESITVRLTHPAGAVLERATATATIVDNDTP